ncbi:MAG: hypothetical protein Q9215_004125 [Flavoplaca cf. flavocitrina]
MNPPRPLSSPNGPELDNMAKALVKRLCEDFTCDTPKSSVSESIYSTAWVSMIPNPPNSTGSWLFPSALDFILERQLDNGGWPSLEASAGNRSWDVDSILNTMAALLALSTRRSSEVEVPDDIEERIIRADASLRDMLQSWNVTSDNVGFEVLVPAHLDMLNKYGLRYDFSARPHLMALREQRLRHGKFESLYGENPSTLLYSLEGLIGKIDFDRIAHHKVHGSMLLSPSSTAAYLMNTSHWDTEAESYLCKSMQLCSVPEVYPTNLFEISWVCGNYTFWYPILTILQPLEALFASFPTHILVWRYSDGLANFLEGVFESKKGLLAGVSCATLLSYLRLL